MTRCRTPCCAPGAGCRASRGEARCAPGSTGSPPTPASTCWRGGLLPEQTQQVTLEALGDARARELVQRYADALERADLDAVLALLTEDAMWSMPPIPTWYRGKPAIAGFVARYPFTQRWRHLA